MTKVRLFKDLEKMLKSSIRGFLCPTFAFSMNQFGQNFHFFSFSNFLCDFLDRIEEKAPRHQKK